MGSDDSRKRTLERSLGLPAALAIGIGTMVGAGIFLFPGLAAGKAGPAAIVSFALAGAIALLVALCTAELATAMPESGGGYYFVSRAFGSLAGSLVGVAQWIGLVFASAFYLAGFGRYAIDLLHELGWELGTPASLIALGAALLLTLVNLLGTESAGKLQNLVVVALTALLTLLFGYGALRATGVVGEAHWPTPFAPHGALPVFTTTALVFTSYLGFVQIATVAGEIREPHRNLPRALVGSVLIVTVLYLLTMFVSTSLLPTARLAELRETATVEVARTIIGRTGALAILGAGLLATLSSANASVLSSSRAAYALSRDALVPSPIARVNERFNTPHVALFAVGLPIAALTLANRLELLAEVASLLHLLLYALICVALLVLRRRRPTWYAPTFRVPGGPVIPTLGALASVAVVPFMQPLSLAVGGGLIVLALGWWALWARGKELAVPRPPHIVPSLRHPRVLMPVEVPDPSPLPHSLLRAVQPIEVLLLGYERFPEQTAPEQGLEEVGDDAGKALEKLVEDAAKRGFDVESDLVATADLPSSLERYVREAACQAVLLPQPTEVIERLLIPVFAEDQANPRLATLVYDLTRTQPLSIELVAMASDGERERAGAVSRAVTAQLVQAGVSRDAIKSEIAETDDLAVAIANARHGNELVIFNESRDRGRERLFAALQREVEDEVASPTLVVLLESEQGDEAEV